MFTPKTAYAISACLVGSKMCVRDGLWTHGLGTPAQRERWEAYAPET